MNLKKLIAAAAAVVMTASAMAASVSAGEVYTWDFTNATGQIDFSGSDAFLKTDITLDSGATDDTYKKNNRLLKLQKFSSYDYINSTNGLHTNGKDRFINYWPSTDGVLRLYGLKKVYASDATTIKVYDKGTNGTSDGNGIIYYEDSTEGYKFGSTANLTATGAYYVIPCTAGHRYQIEPSQGIEISKIEYAETETKIYDFNISNWNDKSEICVNATKEGGSPTTKSISLSELPTVSGDVVVGIAVRITDVPADVAINSVYVQ